MVILLYLKKYIFVGQIKSQNKPKFNYAQLRIRPGLGLDMDSTWTV